MMNMNGKEKIKIRRMENKVNGKKKQGDQGRGISVKGSGRKQ